MKIKVSLQMIRNSNPPTLHPYWWTSDRSIHLANIDGRQEIEVDAEELKFNILQELAKGVRKRVISVEPSENLQKAIDAHIKESAPKPTAEPAPEVQEAKSQEELKEKKVEKVNSELEEQAEELAALSVKKLKEAVGTHVLTENNELQSGISNAKLLKMVKEKEEATESPRKSFIETIDARLEAIDESNKVMISEDEEEVKITVQDLK